jgi:uncharacterized RDD family membrane protein YckC
MNASASSIPPAARPYQGRSAGLVSRFLAGGVDLLVAVAVLIGIYAGWAAILFLRHPATFRFPSPSQGIVVALGFVILTLYLAISWAATGRTYGDQVMGLRVVMHTGALVRLPRALLRALLCVVFPIGLLWVAVSRQNKSLQDIVLGTSVVYDWHSVDRPGTRPAPADTEPLQIPKQHVAGFEDRGTHDHGGAWNGYQRH